MDRGASAGFLTELLASTNSPCFLFAAYFDDGAVYLTDAWRDIVYGGNTYRAQGHFLDFSGLTETAELQVPSLSLTLSAVDQTWISIALTKPYIDRRLLVQKAFLDYTQSVISAPVAIFDGRMDGMLVTDSPDGKCTVGVTATSQWGDFERCPGRHTNPQEQQVFFPGDRYFENCAQLNKSINWGGAPSVQPRMG